MAIYLIDFENVHSDGLKGIEQLDRKDECYIFYSEHAGVLTSICTRKLPRAVPRSIMLRHRSV